MQRAAPECAGLGVLVVQEVAQGHEHQRAESPPVRIGNGIPAAFDEAQEERLGQVFGVAGRVTAALHEGQHRRTVRPA